MTNHQDICGLALHAGIGALSAVTLIGAARSGRMVLPDGDAVTAKGYPSGFLLGLVFHVVTVRS